LDLQFLGAANTVTGSQFLLTTDRARILVDCGMFQGSPNEAVRNRIPLAYDPREIDAILLTHAHLDHCGLIPHVVKEGFKGPIWATKGTVELATLVLLDSGKLQQEFAKRAARRERRHPDEAADDARQEQLALEAAMELAGSGDVADDPEVGGQHVPTRVEPYLAVPQGNGGLGNHGNLLSAPDPEAALKAQPPHLDVELDEPLYDAHDAEAALPLFKGVDYDTELEIAPGIHATFVDAGHILGSAIIRLRAADSEGGPELRIVFSGDLGRRDTPIIRDPTIVRDADYVLIESTYGGREHEPQLEAVRVLADTVRLVADHNGVLLVPSFAIGRTQEVVWELDRLLEQGAIPQLPLYLDSPMASKASDVYRRHSGYFDQETRALLQRGDTPLDYPLQTITRDVKESAAIRQAPRPYMIVASNGMLTGGRVVGHLRELIDDPAAMLLFVGYQGQGTLGAHLQEGATQVKIDGQVRDVRCQVRSISGFSAHADESELLDWLRGFTDGKRRADPGWPRTVFIVHGDPEAQAALEPKVQAMGLDTLVPQWHQRVTLD
jgi:metallo-beta-lactamase family protein